MKEEKDLISRVQEVLREHRLPGWLFYDFRQTDPIAYSILGFPPNPHVTRRWFYLVPAEGQPSKLVHRIESGKLDHLPGEKRIYLRRQELAKGLEELLKGHARLAMQYSPRNDIPYVSRVDAGTMEVVRSHGVEVVSSADLIQHFEAIWSRAQIDGHRRTAQALTQTVQRAFQHAASLIRDQGSTDELTIQTFIAERFEAAELFSDHPAIVAVNANSGDPHYAPSPECNAPIRSGDFLLIDLWAKEKRAPDAVYADITWTAFFGRDVPPRITEVFEVVTRARDRGAAFLKERLEAGRAVQGWEVDDQVRAVIQDAGLGEYFVHRTGHNLGQEVHGNGVHFDNLETYDTRRLLTGSACTIEPGVYLQDFGIRSEINVLAGKDGLEITTPPQRELLLF